MLTQFWNILKNACVVLNARGKGYSEGKLPFLHKTQILLSALLLQTAHRTIVVCMSITRGHYVQHNVMLLAFIFTYQQNPNNRSNEIIVPYGSSDMYINIVPFFQDCHIVHPSLNHIITNNVPFFETSLSRLYPFRGSKSSIVPFYEACLSTLYPFPLISISILFSVLPIIQ